MNAQQIYDTVVRHLAKQGRRSMAPMLNTFNDKLELACAYRGADKTSCAVGCLIPDSEYSAVLESESVVLLCAYLTGTRPESPKHRALGVLAHLRACPTLSALIIEHGELLHMLQRAHDMSPASIDGLTNRLRQIAQDHGLSDSVVSDQTWPDRWA